MATAKGLANLPGDHHNRELERKDDRVNIGVDNNERVPLTLCKNVELIEKDF